MTTAIDHPLLTLLSAAVDGRPAAGVTVLPRPAGRCAAVVGLRGGAVVAADVSASWVGDLLPPWPDDADEHHPALAPPFLVALSRQLGAPPSGLSTLLAAPGSVAAAAGHYAQLADGPLTWSDYRAHVRSYRYFGTAVAAATISVGRGPGGRWDVWLDVEPAHAPRCGHPSAGELLDAVRVLAPPGVPVFASVPAHSARALELAMTLGFRPIGAEVLFAVEE